MMLARQLNRFGLCWGIASLVLAAGLSRSTPAAELPVGRIVLNGERDGNREIYRLDLPELTVHRLSRNPGADEEPELSPDGCWIAYHSERDGNRDLYQMRWDGSGEIRLTTQPGIDEDASWSPDGRQIAFWSKRGGVEDLFSVPAGGGQQRKLTHNRSRSTMRVPAWSPDGKRIAYTSNRSGTHQVYVLDLASGADRAVSEGRPGSCRPDWSPAGELAYVHVEGSLGILSQLFSRNADIVLRPLDGRREARLLTRDPHDDYDPAFSPDGRWIVSASNRHGDYDLFALELASGAERRLTDWKGDERAPHWGPLCR
jgi:TolB protein